jgi:uncharacterized membrane protein YcaP (DUF421 family)
MDLMRTVFGTGTELEPLQMAARAVVVFIFVLALIRLSGRRSFGQRSPFDACTTVLLGAVLSRAVVGASPFVATLAAGVAIVLMHRAIAWFSIRWSSFERLVSGSERVLVDHGVKNAGAMRKALISDRDLAEAARKRFGADSPDKIDRAVLERDGEVSLKLNEPKRNT